MWNFGYEEDADFEKSEQVERNIMEAGTVSKKQDLRYGNTLVWANMQIRKKKIYNFKI